DRVHRLRLPLLRPLQAGQPGRPGSGQGCRAALLDGRHAMTATDMRPRIALYQPDIAGNTGAILRLAACFDLGVDIIAPTGFDMSDRALRRAGMDYLEMAALRRHDSWETFESWRAGHGGRLVLFTTAAAQPYTGFRF